MQLGCLVVFGALYMVWMGGQGLYTSIKNREPMELACGHYGEVKPNREWVKLTDCELDVMESSYMEESGKVVELFIPARGPGEEEGDTIDVLVATKDAELLAAVNQLVLLESEVELTRFIAERGRELHVIRDVQGLVRYGVDLDESDRADLQGLDGNLAEDFVIIDDGNDPGFMKSVGIFGGGIVLLLGVGAVAAGQES